MFFFAINDFEVQWAFDYFTVFILYVSDFYDFVFTYSCLCYCCVTDMPLMFDASNIWDDITMVDLLKVFITAFDTVFPNLVSSIDDVLTIINTWTIGSVVEKVHALSAS